MSIEELARKYLDERLDCPVWLEIPKGVTVPKRYVLIQRTGGGSHNCINTAMIAIQSNGGTLLEAMDLNEDVKTAMKNFVEEMLVSRSSLNTDYNYTDVQTKGYRYQAVYDITHY